jgi:hypothetical protein
MWQPEGTPAKKPRGVLGKILTALDPVRAHVLAKGKRTV